METEPFADANDRKSGKRRSFADAITKGGKLGQVFLFDTTPAIVQLEIKLPKTRNTLEKQRE